VVVRSSKHSDIVVILCFWSRIAWLCVPWCWLIACCLVYVGGMDRSQLPLVTFNHLFIWHGDW